MTVVPKYQPHKLVANFSIDLEDTGSRDIWQQVLKIAGRYVVMATQFS